MCVRRDFTTCRNYASWSLELVASCKVFLQLLLTVANTSNPLWRLYLTDSMHFGQHNTRLGRGPYLLCCRCIWSSYNMSRQWIIKILGVTFTNGLSVTLHILQLIASNAPALYALKLLRAHGLCDTALQAVFRSVVLVRFLYASPAWWGFPECKIVKSRRIFASQHPSQILLQKLTQL